MGQRRAVVEEIIESITLIPRGRGARAFRPEDVRVVWRGAA